LSAIQNLGSVDVLCSDKTGTLTVGEMSLEGSYDPAGHENPRPLQLARLNSRFETGIKSPLDVALLAIPADNEQGWTKLDEVPFDFERRRLSVVVERAGERLLITKGAPDAICERTASFDDGGKMTVVDPAARERWRDWLARAGQRGVRVLAVAYKQAGEQAAWHASDESDLVLAGFLTFADPPLQEAAAAVAGLRADGVVVKVLTGDDAAVACHVCESVGIASGKAVLGADIDRMSDSALVPVAERTSIFARISPAQKMRILLALKRGGHVVGFVGDGINDAPSLRAADVGISVPHAVDVAREAADILLTERGLDVLHGGILGGRRAFGNVTKYLLMGTSSNFGNMVSMAAASILLPFLPMLPTQILLNNLLYDVSQISIPTDDVDPSWLREPHRYDIGLVKRFMLLVGPISSVFDFLTFYVLLRVFHAGEALFRSGWFVESLCTQTLVLFVIRTFERPWRSRPSLPLTATVLAVVALGAALPAMPRTGVLGFVPLPTRYYAFVFVATVAYLAIVEIAKTALLRRGAFLGTRR
jgi:Mg2+-importing ATPase